MALAQLAELTETRADHAASIAALAESAAIGRELGVWGDLTYVEARLALVRARAGDRDRGPGRYARVEQAIAARGGHVDTDRWVLFMRAELAWRDGDYAETARCCEAVLAAIAPNQARWWQSLRAQVKARLALARLRRATRRDAARCSSRPSTRPPPGGSTRRWPWCSTRARPIVVARGGPEGAGRRPGCSARPTRSAARSTSPAWTPRGPGGGPAALGAAGFRAAYDSRRGHLGYAAAADLARALSPAEHRARRPERGPLTALPSGARGWRAHPGRCLCRPAGARRGRAGACQAGGDRRARAAPGPAARGRHARRR